MVDLDSSDNLKSAISWIIGITIWDICAILYSHHPPDVDLKQDWTRRRKQRGRGGERVQIHTISFVHILPLLSCQRSGLKGSQIGVWSPVRASKGQEGWMEYEENDPSPTPDTLLASISHFLGQADVHSLSTSIMLKCFTGTNAQFVSFFVDHPDTQ